MSSNNLHQQLFKAFSRLKVADKSSHINTDYKNLSDMTGCVDLLDDTMHMVVPMERELADHIKLIRKSRKIMQEYLNKKYFILQIYAPSVAQKSGLQTEKEIHNFIQNIAQEMEENLKQMAALSARMGNENARPLDKDIAYNELKSLTDDIIYRLASYNVHYQSYLLDNNGIAEVLYEKNSELA